MISFCKLIMLGMISIMYGFYPGKTRKQMKRGENWQTRFNKIAIQGTPQIIIIIIMHLLRAIHPG